MTVVSVRDVRDQNFVATAHANGLSQGRVLRRHVLPLVLARSPR